MDTAPLHYFHNSACRTVLKKLLLVSRPPYERGPFLRLTFCRTAFPKPALLHHMHTHAPASLAPLSRPLAASTASQPPSVAQQPASQQAGR